MGERLPTKIPSTRLTAPGSPRMVKDKNTVMAIFGDPEAVSRVAGIFVGESRAWAKVYCKNEASPSKLLPTSNFRPQKSLLPD